MLRTSRFVHGTVKNFVPRTSGLSAPAWLAKRPTKCSDDCPPLMPWYPYTCRRGAKYSKPDDKHVRGCRLMA